jgi:hypothetical protein
MVIDWNNPEALREIADAMLKAVDSQIEAANTEGYRSHLGASVVGNECLRYLFYHFHWMHKESYPGRMLRLFEVGHGLESRVRHWLKSIGFQFIDGLEETGTQLKFSDLYGHFGGSVDGVFVAPGWGILEPTGLECKTSGTGSPFNDLDKKGMRETKQQHYIQNSVYGKGLQFKNILYICENKNDSSWYFELVPLDLDVAESAYKKAQFVIFDAQEPPKKISEKRNFFLCGMCSMQGICHDGKRTDVNCRSCRNSRPVQDAQWYCTLYNSLIPSDAILAACPQHNPIQP